MIYFITSDIKKYEELNEKDEIEVINNVDLLKEFIQELKDSSTDDKKRIKLGVDTETTGFDPYISKVLLLQIGNFDYQFVIDATTIDINYYLKDILEDPDIYQIGHNYKFDLRFLYHNKIYPNSVIDTYLQECLLYKGKQVIKGFRGLDACCERYLGIKLDKTIRGAIHKENFSKRVIKYAADDVKYLIALDKAQKVRLSNLDLITSANLENEFLLSLAYTMYCGIKLDVNKWKIRAEKYKKEVKRNEIELNSFIPSNSKFVNKQYDMFISEPQYNINWASEQQVKKFFKEIGLEPKDKDNKITIEESVLAKYKADKRFENLISKFIEYQKNKKQVSTYGDEFLKNINFVSNRIHCEFHQIQDTGRMSSASPNLQNIPADEETRECFISEEGFDFVVADYSGQEQVILANFSQDENLIEFYKSGASDMHCFVASKMYKELEGLSVDEIKKNHKDKRQIAKSAGFAINYGGVGLTIANNTGMSKEEGDYVYESYMRAFPGLKNYFTEIKKKVLKDGIIVINDVIKSKTFVNEYFKYKELNEKVIKEGFWDRYKSDPDFKNNVKPLVRDWAITKSSIERIALNYPIQGTASDMTKLGVCLLTRELKKLNLFSPDKVKYVNIVHDEVDLEIKINYTNKVSELLKYNLEKAGNKFCKTIPIKSSIDIDKYWKK